MSKRTQSQSLQSSFLRSQKRATLSCEACGRLFNSNRALTTHMDKSTFCGDFLCNDTAPISAHHTAYIYQNGTKVPANESHESKDPVAYQNDQEDPTQYVDAHFTDNGSSNLDSNNNNNNNDDDSFDGTSDNQEHPVYLSHETIMSTELLFMLQEAGAPLSLFDKIIAWVENAISRGVTFSGKNLQRKTIIKNLERTFKTENCKPSTIPYMLEGGGKEDVVVFDFKAMFESLINDPRINNAHNLVISETDPTKYKPEYEVGDTLEEMHQGEVCRKSQKELCTTNKDIFCGIVLYIDGTHLGVFSSGRLEPVMMSLTIFNQATRNQSHAWRPIGFINRPEDNDGKEDDIVLRGRNTRNYHRALRLILSRIKQEQNRGGITTNICINGNMHEDMVFKIPVVVVLGDCEGSDDLCGRYKSHSGLVKSLCRDCDCPTAEADSPNVICRPRKRMDLFGATDDELQEMSHYKLDNAFDEIHMADNEQGISGATPPEMLHWLDAGLKKQCTGFLYNEILGKASKKRTAFDSVLAKISQQCGHQSDRDMPIVTFNNGYAKLVASTIKSSEYTGLMLACILTWHTHAGKGVFANKMYQEKRALITDYMHLMEMMLCLDCWMKSGPKLLSTVDEYEHSFRKLMVLYRKLVDRTEGLGLKTTKFHQISHIVRYIKRYGNPQNVNTARPENGHIKNVKNPARLTQRRPSTLSVQTASKCYEKYLIDFAKLTIDLDNWKEKPKKNHKEGVLSGTQCSIQITQNSETSESYFDVDFGKCTPYTIPFSILQYIGETILKNKPKIKVRMGSECYIQQTLYRAHPCYLSIRPWHDFCYYKTQRMHYPRIAKILGFVDIQDELADENDLSCGVQLLCVLATEYPVDLSVLVKTCNLEMTNQGNYVYSSIPVDDVIGPAYCIENIIDENVEFTREDVGQVFVVDPHKTWAENF